MVDASVVGKWFNRGEENEKEATALRNGWVEGVVDLCAPSLLLFEVANSIWKNPRVAPRTARSLVRLAVRISPTLLNPQEQVAEEAMVLARRRKITFYDSIYLAVAKSLGVVLLTADREQLSAASGYTKAAHLSETLEPSL